MHQKLHCAAKTALQVDLQSKPWGQKRKRKRKEYVGKGGGREKEEIRKWIGLVGNGTGRVEGNFASAILFKSRRLYAIIDDALLLKPHANVLVACGWLCNVLMAQRGVLWWSFSLVAIYNKQYCYHQFTGRWLIRHPAWRPRVTSLTNKLFFYCSTNETTCPRAAKTLCTVVSFVF